MAYDSPDTPTIESPAICLMEHAEVSRTVDVFLAAPLALCQEIYRSEAVTHDIFKSTLAEIEAGNMTDATTAGLTDRARRTYSAHLACAGIVAKRRLLTTQNDQNALAEIDATVFNTILAASFMAHMGEDRLSTIEGLAELKSDRAARAGGGKKGNLSRTRWYAEARERYDEYRRLNPQITQASRVTRGILKWGPIQGSPSDERILAVVRKWMKKPRA